MSNSSDLPASEPSQAPRRNRRLESFRALFNPLPDRVKAAAVSSFERFCNNPMHPSLRLHRLRETRKGRHRPDSFSVSVGSQYRALFFEDGDANLWYWIGTHADYDEFTGAT